MSKRVAIQLDNVSFGYEKNSEAVSNVSFSIDERSTAMLIGPNGSGKTTLLKMMVGLLEPNEGSVEVYGESPKNMRHIVGYVPQRLDFDQTFPMTVKEFLHFSQPASDDKILKMLASLGVKKLAHKSIGSLSGGQLQRILIARSLLGSPKILFLDEPSSGIDIGGEQNFYELIQGIQKQHGVTVVLVSHQIQLVTKIADQVICVNKEMICCGDPAEALVPDVIERLFGEQVTLHRHGR